MNENTTQDSNPYAAGVQPVHDQVQGELALASLWSRFFAAMIDGILMAVLTIVPAMMFFGGFQAYGEAMQGGFLVKLTVLAISYAAYLLVNGYFLEQNGQSIGKKALGIKIVRSDGSKADFARIALRRQSFNYLVQLVPFVGWLIGLVDVLFIFRDSKKCVHDEIADTVVIQA
jgi:uncharacterized RDD family membrane protein YckC